MTPAVLRYYLYKATRAVELYRPVMYLYFLSVGLSFTQLAFLEAAYNVTTVLAEVPTGYVGDRIGRRLSLVVGTGVIAATLAGIAFATTFPALLSLYVLWSVGYAFRSGSEDAWLYDSLTGEGEFAEVRGRGESVALAVGVGGAVVGGWLAGIGLTYPFLVAAVVTAVGAAVLLTVEEPADAPEFDPLTPRRAADAIRDALSDPRLRSFVPYYYVLFSAVTYLVFIFLQPRIEAVVATGPAAELVTLTGGVEPLLGWYYAGISLVGAALTGRAGWLREHVGVRTWFVAIPLVVAALLVGQWAIPLVALPAFLLVRGLSEATSVFAASYVNDRLVSVGRATTLSAMAMVSGLTVVPFQLAGGSLSDQFSPGVALAAAGVVLAAGSLAILAWRAPVPAETGAGTEAGDAPTQP
ncbi:MFS transporter [Halobaculum limi]|uniref:MFS transporter n=1 Tax=Halobaculum limi TaxID=3031916 RepID=UPI0024049F0B|nr:MFS transporter [Halobaculum sp. YSMS11]